MIKTSIAALVMVCSIAPAVGQQFNTSRETFLSNKLYVIFSGDPTLDTAIKESFINYWTLQPIVGFVTETQAKDLIPDVKNSFFIIGKTHWAVSNKSYGGRDGAGVYAFNGGKKSMSKYYFWDLTTSKPIDLFCNEQTFDKVAYRTPLIVADLQYDINKGNEKPNVRFDKNKILLVNQELLKGNAKKPSIRADALATWPWKHEVKSSKEIAQLIRTRDKRYILLTPTLSDANCSLMLHDLETMKLIVSIGRSAIMGLPWVRGKEMEKLVEAVTAAK